MSASVRGLLLQPRCFGVGSGYINCGNSVGVEASFGYGSGINGFFVGRGAVVLAFVSNFEV
jgi:hypothetical protein